MMGEAACSMNPDGGRAITCTRSVRKRARDEVPRASNGGVPRSAFPRAGAERNEILDRVGPDCQLGETESRELDQNLRDLYSLLVNYVVAHREGPRAEQCNCSGAQGKGSAKMEQE
jgi:hypothetical protein